MRQITRTGLRSTLLAALAMLAMPAPAAAGEAGATADGRPLEKISVMFHWKSQAQWAGYYMAREKGIYARHGLDVTLIPRQGRSDALDPLLDGRVDISSHFLAGGMGVRGLKHPVHVIGQMFNRSNLMIVARRSAGIQRLADLKGKKVAYWDGYYSFVFRAFFARHGLRPQGDDGYVERPMGLQVTQFTTKQVDACSAMEYNEFRLIRSALGGEADELFTVRLRENGMDYPEDALFTTEKNVRERPDACRAFVAATLEGWRYARDNREETLDVVMREIAADPASASTTDGSATREHSAWMLDICVDSVFPPEGSARRPGVLLPADFEAVRGFLKDNGQLRHDFDYADFARLYAVDGRAAAARP